MMQGSNAVPFIDFNKKYKVTSVMKNNFTVTPPPVYAKGEHLKTVQYAYQHTQGGCVAKGFLYTCMHCPFVQPNKCIIIKQELSSGKIVGFSREYEFGHANDATYNPHNNTIVPQIYLLLDKYSGEKSVTVLRSREEADEYVESIKITRLQI